MSASNLYTPQYHDAIAPGSDRSATVIVPLVTSLLPCRSVVDVGCGTGAWLAEFVRAAGDTARAMVGVDGHYVERSRLMIDPEKFVAADLNEPLPRGALLERCADNRVQNDRNGPAAKATLAPKPTPLPPPPQPSGRGSKFDLAVCLEVAEHIRPERSEGFVDDLCALADVVLFSAAIPYQGGEGHINERWPTFWQELFKARGFELVDPIRKRVWSDRRVEPWYQQNTVMYAHWRAIGACPRIAEEHRQTFPGFLSMVHPRLYGPLVERTGLKPAGPWVPEGLRDRTGGVGA